MASTVPPRRALARWPLAGVLAVLEAELDIVAQGQAGNLDELRRERAQSTPGRTVDAPGTSSEGRR